MIDEDSFFVRYGKAWKFMVFDEPQKTDYPLMQYTGLKDKNGVEIYEGDIVDTHNRHIGIVKYYPPSFTIDDYDDGDYYVGQDPCCWTWSQFEVIGNIHETPELLESNK